MTDLTDRLRAIPRARLGTLPEEAADELDRLGGIVDKLPTWITRLENIMAGTTDLIIIEWVSYVVDEMRAAEKARAR